MQGYTESPWRRDENLSLLAPQLSSLPLHPHPQDLLNNGPGCPCVPWIPGAPHPEASCGFISHGPMTHHPGPVPPHRPLPSEAPLNWAARLIHKAQEASWTQRSISWFSCSKHNLPCSYCVSDPSGPNCQKPKQLTTGRSWLAGCGSLVSGRVYMLALLLLTWSGAPNPQIRGRSPTRRPGPPPETQGEGALGHGVGDRGQFPLEQHSGATESQTRMQRSHLGAIET